MVIVTTRIKDPRVWGPRVNLRELWPLDDATAAKVLTDLAPDVPDLDHSESMDLGHRLGGLPLALHLARQRVQGDDHPATMTTRDNLARVTGLQGRHGEAEQMFIQILADRSQKIGKNHPHTLTTRHRLARVIADQGRYDEAERMFREVLVNRERVLGDQHPNTLTTRHRLAQAIADQGRYDEAERLFRQVLADRERVLGQQHPDTMTTRSQLALIPASSGLHRPEKSM